MRILQFVIFVLLLVSCQRDFEIISLDLGNQRQIVGDHYDSDMTLCLSNSIGNSGFSFSMFIKTNDGKNIKCSKDIHVNTGTGVRPDDNCIDFTTRPFFNKKGATKEDHDNMKSLRKGNVKSIRVVIWDDSFENVIAEKTFNDL